MGTFIIYQLLYLVLEKLINKNSDESMQSYLEDANPYIVEGENSCDPFVYIEFKNAFKESDSIDYGYEFILNYLKNLDSYYGDIYSLFKLSKEEYIDACNKILNNKSIKLKMR